MANRITVNPYLEECPDYAAVPFAPIIARYQVGTQLTIEQAIDEFKAAWSAGQDMKKAAWNQQEANDAAAAEVVAQQAEAQLEQEKQEVLQQKELEAKEREKKQPKLGDFEIGVGISSRIPKQPSVYATAKLEKGQYVEIWYFSPKGCADTLSSQLTSTPDHIGLSDVKGVLILRSAVSTPPSKKVIPDKDLSWDEMTKGGMVLVNEMTRAGWNEKHVKLHARLFVTLQSHYLRWEDKGEAILLTYLARVRREWHALSKLEQTFDISVINDVLLEQISSELFQKLNSQSTLEVSPKFIILY